MCLTKKDFSNLVPLFEKFPELWDSLRTILGSLHSEDNSSREELLQNPSSLGKILFELVRKDDLVDQRSSSNIEQVD